MTEIFQPLQRSDQMGTALAAHQRMNFIDDDRINMGESLARGMSATDTMI